VDEIYDLGHRRLRAAFAFRGPRKLDRFAISKETAGQQEIVEVRGRGLQIEGVHLLRARVMMWKVWSVSINGVHCLHADAKSGMRFRRTHNDPCQKVS
jgi:hypothetical protein